VSVLDDFRAAEQRVAQRLKELEPAVAEYRELEAVAQRLGIDAGAAVAEAAPAARTRRAPQPRRARAATATNNGAPKQAPAGARRRTPAGGREQQLLELVRARPGITVREAGQDFGVDPTSLYRLVRRLEQNGQLRKKGRGLEPVAS
jgi:transcriptional regulator with GAF, ATPase, and Fis domain